MALESSVEKARAAVEPRLFGGETAYKPIRVFRSGCVLRGQCSHAFAMPLRRGYDLHLLPVVGEFFAALQTSNVGAGQAGGLRTPPGAPDRYWKTIAGVMATENCVEQLDEHGAPSTSRDLIPVVPFFREAYLNGQPALPKYLDSCIR